MSPASQPTMDPISYIKFFPLLHTNLILPYNTPQVNSPLQQNLIFLYISNLSFYCSHKYQRTTATTIISQSSSQGILLGAMEQERRQAVGGLESLKEVVESGSIFIFLINQ